MIKEKYYAPDIETVEIRGESGILSTSEGIEKSTSFGETGNVDDLSNESWW